MHPKPLAYMHSCTYHHYMYNVYIADEYYRTVVLFLEQIFLLMYSNLQHYRGLPRGEGGGEAPEGGLGLGPCKAGLGTYYRA